MGKSEEETKKNNATNEEGRKLSKLETQAIKDTIELLFAKHYVDLGYNFRENDIDIFFTEASKIKLEAKTQLPMNLDLEYCYEKIQDILYIVRLLRYEQRTLSRYILRCNIKLKDFYYMKMDKKTLEKALEKKAEEKTTTIYIPSKTADQIEKELEGDLLKVVGFIAEIEAIIQYLCVIFDILGIGKTKYKELKYTLVAYKKEYSEFTLTEYLHDNIFFDDIFEELNEVKDFLYRDNYKAYNEIVKKLNPNTLDLAFDKNDTKITIVVILQTIKYLDKELLKKLDKMQDELKKQNNYVDRKVFESYLLNKNTGDLQKTSISYLDAVREFYKKQILLEGAKFDKNEK